MGTVVLLGLIIVGIQRGANPNATLPHGGWTALHLAIENGNIAKAEVLIKGGASIDQRNRYGKTALIMAVDSPNNLAMVKRLVALGADITASDKIGVTALYRAVSRGDKEMVLFLLQNGADPMFKRGLRDWSPLERARTAGAMTDAAAGDPDIPARAREVTKVIEEFLAVKQQ